MVAHEAALKDVAYSKLRRLLAYSASFNGADVAIGDSALSFKAANRKSAPRWRGPAKILDVDGTGAAAKFRSQTYNVARYGVRKEVKEKDSGKAEWRPAS